MLRVPPISILGSIVMNELNAKSWTVKEIFLRASELESSDQRQAYLDEVCSGDLALMHNVLAMLKARGESA